MDEIDKLAWERMTFIAFMCCLSGAMGWVCGNVVGYKESQIELKTIKSELIECRKQVFEILVEVKSSK